ncbi:MAG TPA: nitrile hydratase accessory protein [Kiloniellaceae bacterium]|nr:nitrile hydratase accessory protein [Kiloniellaceae bacterium]
MTDTPDLTLFPGLPREGDAAVFAAPWQAQAFALAISLHQAGHFTWSEWAGTLAEEIKAAQAAGDPDLGDSYYEHWLACLERLLAEKGILSAEGLVARKEAWRKAAAATPHGQPILLPDA